MTTLTTLRIYSEDPDDNLTERAMEYHCAVAKRKLKRRFKEELEETYLSDLNHADFQIMNWPECEAELLEFSKTLPCVYFFIMQMHTMEIHKGAKL